jgi:hypothetical protein
MTTVGCVRGGRDRCRGYPNAARSSQEALRTCMYCVCVNVASMECSVLHTHVMHARLTEASAATAPAGRARATRARVSPARGRAGRPHPRAHKPRKRSRGRRGEATARAGGRKQTSRCNALDERRRRSGGVRLSGPRGAGAGAGAGAGTGADRQGAHLRPPPDEEERRRAHRRVPGRASSPSANNHTQTEKIKYKQTHKDTKRSPAAPSECCQQSGPVQRCAGAHGVARRRGKRRCERCRTPAALRHAPGAGAGAGNTRPTPPA